LTTFKRKSGFFGDVDLYFFITFFDINPILIASIPIPNKALDL